MDDFQQTKPSWCPMKECGFIRITQDSVCCGVLSKPEPHDEAYNTHRICFFDGIHPPQPFMVNETDLEYFRWIFDAIDGKKTSWLSRRDAPPQCPVRLTTEKVCDSELADVSEQSREDRVKNLDELRESTSVIWCPQCKWVIRHHPDGEAIGCNRDGNCLGEIIEDYKPSGFEPIHPDEVTSQSEGLN